MRSIQKILSVILALLMAFSIIPINASAATISGNAGESITWEFDTETGVLTFSGEGEMPWYNSPYYGYARPWESIIDDVKHVVIEHGITSIGDFAFSYSDSLETVTMNSVVKIYPDAFDYCTNLKTVTMSKSIKDVKNSVFTKCEKLTYIYYAGTESEWNIVSIGANDELEDVKVYTTDYVVFSDYGIVDGPSGENSITWTFDAYFHALTISGEGMMYDDWSMDEMLSGPYYKYKGLREWDYFKYDIKKVIVDEGITYIGRNSFRFFPNLTEVVIPESVTEIGKMAFRTCDAITDVYYSGTEEQWQSITIGDDNAPLLNARIHYNYVECEHNYGATVVTEPTCINRGYTTHICTNCNESYVDNFLDFGSCAEYVKVVVPPTCTRQGWIAYECPLCHKGYVDEYFDPSHQYEPVSVTNPTCTTQGYTTFKCSGCGKTVNDDYISSLGHDFGETIETIAPTCTEQGYSRQKCNRCDGVFKSNIVQALGHSYKTVVTEPTCVEQGYTTYICVVCEYTTVGDYIEATGHVCDNWNVTKEPGCTYAGTRTGVCSVCNEEVNETISRLGHDYGELTVEYEPTCTKDGRKSKKCSRCDSKSSIVIVPALGHSFGDWEQVDDAKCGEYGKFERYCSSCGQIEVMNAPADHDYSIENIIVEATCTAAGSKILECSGCGKTTIETIPATGHKYTSEITTPSTHLTEGLMTYTCDCGDSYTETIEKIAEHNHDAVVTAPTCTERGYTTYTCECGDSYVSDYIDALGHTHSTAFEENYVAPTCTAEGSKDVVIYCSVCDEEISRETVVINATGHSHTSVVTSPTCTEQGYTTYTCECGDSYVDDYVDALGHTPSTAFEENYVAPTCIEDGSKDVVVYCSVCDEEISRETANLEATGHADNDGNGYCDADNALLDPSVECDHNCHKGGISGFFWKITLFFSKIFGTNKVCDCGVAHY